MPQVRIYIHSYDIGPFQYEKCEVKYGPLDTKAVLICLKIYKVWLRHVKHIMQDPCHMNYYPCF